MNENAKLSLYYRLPYFIQQWLFNLKAKQKYQNRVYGEFDTYYNRIKSLWNADLIEIKNYQERELIRLLNQAYMFSDWYKNVFDVNKIDINYINKSPYKVLKKLPFLTKEDIKNNLDQIANKNPDLGEGIINYTSGSTGSPMKTLACENSENRLHAIKKRFHTSVGVPFKNRCVRLSGNQIIAKTRKRPPFWHHNKYENIWFFSLYHITKNNLPSYINKLNEVKPHLLDGYPSGIYVLANYILNNNCKLTFTPKAICTTAEPLTVNIRVTIEEAFQCKVFNQYSSSEGATFITECKNGKLHINEDTGIIEYFNEEGETGKPGERCEMVVTGFINKKTPLIRYKTGDWVQLPKVNESCSCGCNMPVVSEIFGRFEDYLIDENGVEQGMVSYRVFKKADHIIKAQIIQKSEKNVTVKLVKDDGYDKKEEDYIKSKIRDILGGSIELNFNYVRDIELGPNGKFKTVKRKF